MYVNSKPPVFVQSGLVLEQWQYSILRRFYIFPVSWKTMVVVLT